MDRVAQCLSVDSPNLTVSNSINWDVTSDIKEYQLPKAPLDFQNDFVEFVHVADKSKICVFLRLRRRFDD